MSFRRIFGHLHDGGLPEWLDDGRTFCSCVMRHDGYLVPLEKVLETLAA